MLTGSKMRPRNAVAKVVHACACDQRHTGGEVSTWGTLVQAGMGGHGRLLGAWGQQMAQKAVGARAGEGISGRLGVLAMRTLRASFLRCPVLPTARRPAMK